MQVSQQGSPRVLDGFFNVLKKGWQQIFQPEQLSQISRTSVSASNHFQQPALELSEITPNRKIQYLNDKQIISGHNIFQQACFQKLLSEKDYNGCRTIITLAIQLLSFGTIEDDYEYVAQLISEVRESHYQPFYSNDPFIELSIRFIEYKEKLSFTDKKEAWMIALKIIHYQEHYAYHGTSLAALEEIEKVGLKRERKLNQEIIKIKQIADKIFPEAYGDSSFFGPCYERCLRKIYVANDPNTSYSYAEYAPEWFYMFSGGSTNTSAYSESKEKFQQKIAKRLEYRQKIGRNEPIEQELQQIEEFFEKNWIHFRSNQPRGVICKIKHSFNPNQSTIQKLADYLANDFFGEESFNSQQLKKLLPKKDDSKIEAFTLSRIGLNFREIFIAALESHRLYVPLRNNEGIEDKDFTPQEIESFIVPLKIK